MNRILKTYQKLSNVGKILLFVAILLIIVLFFKAFEEYKRKREGFESTANQDDETPFLFKQGSDLFDDFYVNVYDSLVYNAIKNQYEMSTITKQTNITERSRILDVGSGTGHHVGALQQKGIDIIGVDISPAMVKKAKANYPQGQFEVGDCMDATLFEHNSFTHIFCLYFTLYYIENKRVFFDNCMDWLMPGGYLLLHLVNRDKFDPILPPGNPLYIVSPQKYAKNRITTTKVTFHDFVYQSNFQFNPSGNDVCIFEEKFKFNNGKARKQEHALYMETTDAIIQLAQQCGFVIQGKIDLVKCAYEHQYVYILVKPN